MVGFEDEEDLRKRYELLGVEDDEVAVTVEGEGINPPELTEYCYVGLLFSEKEINETAFKRTISKVWQPKFGVNIKTVAPNKFLFTFFHRYDYERAWEGSPWSFNNRLLALAPKTTVEVADSVHFNQVPIWVQIFGVPIGYVTMQVCEAMGKFIGGLIEVDENNFKVSRPIYLRVRVTINPFQSLKRRMKLCINANRHVIVQFQYECLPSICFICGSFHHSEATCPLNYVGEGKPKRMYEPSIRATLRKNMITEEDKWLRDEKGSNLIPTGSTSLSLSFKETQNRVLQDVDENLARCRGEAMETEIEVIDPKRKRGLEHANKENLAGGNNQNLASSVNRARGSP